MRGCLYLSAAVAAVAVGGAFVFIFALGALEELGGVPAVAVVVVGIFIAARLAARR